MALTYAGVSLVVPTPGVCRWVERQLGSAGLRPPGPPGWPATKLAGLSSFAYPPHFRCRLGSLYWPAGASRFAVGHYLASTRQLDAIYEAMPAGEVATLAIGTGVAGVTTDMYMLPPRPLAQVPDGDGNEVAGGLYLITLVDERYFLWGAWSNYRVEDGSTEWGDAVAAIAGELEIDLGADEVPPGDWGYAPEGMDLRGEPAALCLDAVCYACGLQVVRSLDGTYSANDADADREAVNAQLTDKKRISGGAFSLNPDDLPGGIGTVDDQPLALPETVRLVVRDGTGETHATDVLLQDQDGDFESVRPDTVQGWKTTRQGFDAGDAEAYAGSLGRSSGIRTLATTARRFAGIVPWEPEGVSEAVEWVYRGGEASTFVHPAAWFDGIIELVGLPDAAGGVSSSMDRVKVTGAAHSVGDCSYYPGKLRNPGTNPGCDWADGDDVWVTPGGCSALVNGAEYWAKKVKPATVTGESRPTYVAVQRADCCDCGSTPAGYTTEYTCTVDMSGTVCVDGAPVKKTVQYCLPFKVAKHSKSETVDPAACGGTTDVEVPITPLTITQTGCTFVFSYTSKILRLPSSWVLTGHTFP